MKKRYDGNITFLKIFLATAPILTFAALAFPSATLAQTGALQVVVAGRELAPSVRAERRGSNTLIPVVPIARELGYLISVDAATEKISVRRVGIKAEFDKKSGEIRENGVTITVAPFAAEVIFAPDPDLILLPLEAAAPLLNVSIFVDSQKNIVRVDSREVSSATVSRERGKFEVAGVNYTANVNYLNGFFYQNLNLISNGRIGSRLYQANVNFLGGGNYKPLNFYGGNIIVTRPNVDEIQIGDLTTSVGTELSLMNTLVRGASYSRPLGERMKASVYGGRSYSGFTDNFFRRNTPALPFDTTLVGGRVAFNPQSPQPNVVSRRNLYFSVGSVFFTGANNRGWLFDGTARYVTEKFNLEAQIAAGNFNILTQDKRRVSGFGTGIILGGSFRPWRFLTLQGRYDRFSPNFSNPSRLLTYNNRNSISASISFQPLRNLSFGLSGNLNNNRNELFARRDGASANARTESYGASFGYDPQNKFLPRVSITGTTLKNSYVGSYTFLNVNLSHDYARFRPFANYIMTKFRADASHGFNFGSSIDTGKYGDFRLQHSFSLSKSPVVNEQTVRCQIDPQQCPVNFISKYQINNNSTFADWMPHNPLFKILQLSVGGGYAKYSDKTSLEFRTTAGIGLPFRQNLQIGYSHTAYNNEFRLSMTGPLMFWKSKKRYSESEPTAVLLTESSIQGRVYLDENGNRQYDAGTDEAMPGVHVRLNNGQESVTDANGNYSFPRTAPGETYLAVEIADIRANLIPANGLEQNLTVAPRSFVTSDFRLVKSGSLSGRVWNDANANGKFDEGEGLTDIHVVSSSGKDTYTEPDGAFFLSELPPGEQTIFIDERYQPEDLIIPSLSLRATVRSGQLTENVAFSFKTKPRGVKIITFDPKPAPAGTPTGDKKDEN